MTGAHDRNVHKNIARRWFEAASGPGVRYTSAWRFGDTGCVKSAMVSASLVFCGCTDRAVVVLQAYTAAKNKASCGLMR